MSRKAELSENILATRMEGVVVWAVERRIQILISIGIAVAIALIGSVFLLRRNQAIDENRTKLAYAQTLVAQRAYAEAAPVLAEVRAAHADADTARLAAYLGGVAALEQNKPDEAIPLLTQAVDESAGHLLRPLARSVLGTALEQKKDFAGAAGVYAAFISETPEHFLSPRIQLSLGRANLLAGNVNDANRAFSNLIDQFPTSEWAEMARRMLNRNQK